ncbi:hypothetical protein BU23DRAFT_478428 [Bimuria novae-zelandiae CBS 107.79]|uniref:Uncharacterized protein n=1 Tax=Bimuria novae-zelandiae CBS 107.79 TaxID=1447943 RepID=A0A6A5V6L7_9PLEO|nr:hypothetical protein BU23DRAFT_478428 [Bimuria novae-zelandiae CBS 107.79]
MAEVVAPGHSTTEARRGTKRAADNALESEQRLSKRFDLLNLENGTRLYLPVPRSSSSALNPTPPTQYPPQAQAQSAKPLHIPASPEPRKKKQRPRRPPPDDCMQVEDTPHRVYIADLDAELSDIESDEDNPIFLQDIEKHLAKIPQHVLRAPEPKPTNDNQLILYNVPSSLTVPEAQDSVRKAIVEARGRMRERQVNGQMSVPAPVPGIASMERQIPPPSFDGDEMEID